MTNSEFLQNIEMDRRRKAEMSGPRREDIERMRGMMSPQKPSGMMQGMGSWLGNTLNDVGIAFGRGSQNPIAQQIGKSFRTSNEQSAYDEEKAAEALAFLQKEEQARAMQAHRNAQIEMRRNQMNSQNEYHNSSLAEATRHHKAIEGRQTAQETKYAREEEKVLKEEMRNAKLQEKEPGAFYLDALPVSERNQYVKAQQNAIKGMSSQKEAIIALTRMKELVKKNPGISNYINSMWGPGKGKLGALNQLRMSDKDRTATNLFEKYQNDLIKLKVESLAGSGARPNMFLEKIVSKSVGELGMTADALTENFDHSIGEMKRSLHSKDKIKKDISRRIYNPYSMDEEPETESEQEPTEEDIDAAIARKLGRTR